MAPLAPRPSLAMAPLAPRSSLAMAPLAPRPSSAPRLANARGGAVPIPRSRSPHLRPRQTVTASSQRQDVSFSSMPIAANEVESVLGQNGSTLVHCCRESRASISLRPALVDESSDFIADVQGPPDAVDFACELLREVVRVAAGAKEDRDPALSTYNDSSPIGNDAEDRFEIPRNRVPFVLGGRQSGCKGVGKKEGIKDLEESAGCEMIVLPNEDPSAALSLQIRGLPDVVEEVRRVLRERLEGCGHLLDDYIDCPVVKMPVFCGKAAHALEEIELASGACVNVKRGKQHCFEREDGEKMCQIEIIGTLEQIEHAAQLVRSRLDSIKVRDEDKGQSKGRKRGKCA